MEVLFGFFTCFAGISTVFGTLQRAYRQKDKWFHLASEESDSHPPRFWGAKLQKPKFGGRGSSGQNRTLCRPFLNQFGSRISLPKW